MSLTFYLGTHRPTWLWQLTNVPLFVSHRILSERKSAFPAATTDWALDSGGFTELSMFGQWNTTPAEYVEAVYRYRDEIGRMAWASPQDWMCEPWITAKTGKTVAEHQALTVENYLLLRDMAPDLPFVPVLQGWELDDYHRCADLYAEAGVDLTKEHTVGVGSVCRRQAEGSIAMILQSLQARGLNLHGYGVKTEGLQLSADFLRSADSLAWSYGARMAGKEGVRQPCGRKSCSNCQHYALAWRERLLSSIQWRQGALPLGGAA